MSAIKIYKGGLELDYKRFNFPAGEVSIKLDAANYKFKHFEENVTLFARLHSGDDFMALALIKDALEEMGEKNIKLFIPYFNYAQQDRVCDNGESFSLNVFAKLINSLNFSKVTVVDPHSGVLNKGLVNNLYVISQKDILNRWDLLINELKGCIFVAPDAGANKKTSDLAKYFEHKEFVRADKLRDLTNGKIIETIVYKDDFKGQNVAIADDICVGGGTFIALAIELKKKNAGKITLFCTHGIFSNGVDILLGSRIDKIFVTNSYKEDYNDYRVNTFNLRTLLNKKIPQERIAVAL
jgi:ribose-phosphate pyrophosphokinase